MADRTSIEWTDATWNPVVGCSVLSPGCTHCYAMILAGGRLKNHPTRVGLTDPSKAGPVWNGNVRFNAAELVKPMRWRRPRRIFVCAHGDLFHEAVPTSWIDQVYAVMALSPQHTFQVLTKRAERRREYLTDPDRIVRLLDLQVDHPTGRAPLGELIDFEAFTRPLPNVWEMTSAEDQVRAIERIPALMATPAAVRGVSLEPLLLPVNIAWALSWSAETSRRLDWVIVGGESGPRGRPMHPDWVRQIRDDCAAAGIAFFFKQWGAWAPAAANTGPGDGLVSRVGKRAAGRLLDGRIHDAMPHFAKEAA
ncbi:MAG: phage Gp37/Gp68 family protein [Caulobacteraceae bacterium]|nr:phage Gp37/Gp68 family protein [Caulobacteraceae bacterium]